MLVIYILFQGAKGYRDANSVTGSVNHNSVFHWSPTGDYEFPIVGESFYQPAIAKIVESRPGDWRSETFEAMLVPDNNNEYDKLAVRVDIEGATVGHLSRENARKFRRRLSGKKMAGAITSCDAMINGGFELDDGSMAFYGVRLDLKPFE